MRRFFLLLSSLFASLLVSLPVRAADAPANCPVGPRGCCIEVTQPADKEGKGEIRRETCSDGSQFFYADCYCKKGDTTFFHKPGLAADACKESCAKESAGVDGTQGVGASPASTRTPSASPVTNAMCFDPEQCATAGGAFEGASPACPRGQGKCIAPEPVVKLSSPVLGTQTVTGIREYVALMFKYLLQISLIAAAVMFIYGGFKYLLSSSGIEIGDAKKTMTSALVGVLLLYSSITILNAINPALTIYPKLKIYLINKMEWANYNLCKDYKSSPEKPLTFAYSGDPASSVPFDKASFDFKKEETACGDEYYVNGMSGKTCKGRMCPFRKACLACKSGIEGCTEGRSFACVSAVMAGNVVWSADQSPTGLFLIPVCGNALGQPSAAAFGKEIGSTQKIDLKTSEGFAQREGLTRSESGVAAFVYDPSPEDLGKMEADCAEKGGLQGFALGLRYQSKASSTARGTVQAVSFDLNKDADIVGAIAITKKDCGSSTAFAGYARGLGIGDAPPVEALYCGLTAKGGTAKADDFWKYEELKAVLDGNAVALTCDINLGSNAPFDTGKLLPSCIVK